MAARASSASAVLTVARVSTAPLTSPRFASTRAVIRARRSRTGSGMPAVFDSLNASMAPSASPSRSRSVASVAPNPARAGPGGAARSSFFNTASARFGRSSAMSFSASRARIGSPSGPSASNSAFSSSSAINSAGAMPPIEASWGNAANASRDCRSISPLWAGKSAFAARNRANIGRQPPACRRNSAIRSRSARSRWSPRQA